MMNMQEAFDRSVTGVIAQGCRAYDRTVGSCVYLDSDGNRCAVGQLMTEDGARACKAYGLFNIRDEFLPEISDAPDRLVFLRMLQKAHDDCTDNEHAAPFVDQFKERALSLALRLGLIPDAAR